jgi:hypothetical protein
MGVAAVKRLGLPPAPRLFRCSFSIPERQSLSSAFTVPFLHCRRGTFYGYIPPDIEKHGNSTGLDDDDDDDRRRRLLNPSPPLLHALLPAVTTR